jgi:hypothetical protein
MTDGAILKVNRASEHIADLNKLFREQPPFTYVVETNTQTGERATLAKKNEALVKKIAMICGDAAHNLRASLDHAFWDIVSPFATTDAERRRIQFPFVQEAARLDEAVKQRFADRVSQKFFDAIKGLRPYKEKGGNELLYLIEELDILDKHRLLIPMADYKTLTSAILRAQVPDFPIGSTSRFGDNDRDVVWTNKNVAPDQLGSARPPTTYQFERKLDVPLDIIFERRSGQKVRPLIPTLDALVDVAKQTISDMRSAVN